MKHTGHNTILWDYLAGNTGPEENERIEDHLKVCSACRKDLAELEMLEDFFSKSRAEKPSSQFMENTMLKLEEKKPIQPVETVFTRHELYLIGRKLAAVIVIGLVTGVLLVRFSSFGVKPETQSQDIASSWSYETMTGEEDLIAYESYFLTQNSDKNENQDE